MTAMPIRPTKAPSAVLEHANGALPPDMLANVDRTGTDPRYMMATLPARGMRAMHAACRADTGIQLSTTGRLRDLAGQHRIFCGSQARYQPCDFATYTANKALGKELTKRWPASDYPGTDGTTAPGRNTVAALLGVTIPASEWWTKITLPGGGHPATAAVPGTSPHGRGCADDLALPDGPDLGTDPDGLTAIALEWLYSHELDYGFAHSTKTEPWHVQWYVGDVVPAAVLAYEVSLAPKPPTPPIPNQPPQEDEPMELIRVNDDAAVLLRDGLICTAISEQVTKDSLIQDGIVPNQPERLVHRQSLKGFVLRGPKPDYTGYPGPLPGRTVPSDFAKHEA